MAGIAVTAIADPSPAALRAAQRSWPNARLYETPEELTAEDLDALLVATPPSRHWPLWRLARARRLPVFMEKPFPPPELAEDLESDPDAPVLLMVDFSRRFWPLYQELRAACAERVAAGFENAVFRLHVNLRAWSGNGGHRVEPAEGGALWDLGSQMVDLAIFVLNEEPASVSIEKRPDRSTAQRYVIRLRFPRGPVVCDVAYGSVTREQIAIRGKDGTLRVAEPNMDLRWETGDGSLRGAAAWVRGAALLATRALLRRRSMLRYSIAAALSEFFSRMRKGQAFEPGPAEALRVTRILAAGGPRLETAS